MQTGKVSCNNRDKLPDHHSFNSNRGRQTKTDSQITTVLAVTEADRDRQPDHHNFNSNRGRQAKILGTTETASQVTTGEGRGGRPRRPQAPVPRRGRARKRPGGSQGEGSRAGPRQAGRGASAGELTGRGRTPGSRTSRAGHPVTETAALFFGGSCLRLPGRARV